MKEILCPKCKSNEIEAKYTTYILVNDMVIEEDKDRSYRYCESTDHYLDGDLSEFLICLQCSHTWEDECWHFEDHKEEE